MIPELIKQWEENKYKLEDYFRTTEQEKYSDSYESILKKIIELVITNKDEHTKYDATKITVVDHGEYQGTQIFLIPTDDYQPSIEDYLITHTYYGSCTGCDTLQSISYEDGLPTEEEVKEYMTLALHLVQKMKIISDTEDDD
jgi:hypothetical protein